MATDFTPGLVASWELDEASGNFVDAVSAMAFVPSGLTQGVTAIIPNSGTAAASGDGVNDDAKLTPPPDAVKFGTASFAYEIWVKQDSVTEVGRMFICQRTTTALGANLEVINDPNQPRLYIQDGASNSANIVGTAAFAQDALYQILAICDRTNQLLRLYVNGASAATAVDCSAVGSISTTSDYFQIFAAAAGQFLAGDMQRFRIWTGTGAEFTATKASALYNSGNGLSYGQLSPAVGDGMPLALRQSVLLL